MNKYLQIIRIPPSAYDLIMVSNFGGVQKEKKSLALCSITVKRS